MGRKGTKRNMPGRFWDKVSLPDWIGMNECWIWQASKIKDGYGLFWFKNKMCLAHRFAYELCCGAILEGFNVLHNCPAGDNPSCVNPQHLWLGTDEDNAQDRDSKGRTGHMRGEENGAYKFTEQQIKTLLDRYETESIPQADLARELKMSKTNVSAIVNKRLWKHIHKKESVHV